MDKNLEHISDGRFYECNDMVKVGCHDCAGCSECCRDMGQSVLLDPYDICQLTTHLGKSFEELMDGFIELHVEEGLVLPNLRMAEAQHPSTPEIQSAAAPACVFLNAQGRCSIHDFRPGICRLFPLGRNYTPDHLNYFLLVHECPARNKTKMKVSKWLDCDRLRDYQQFLLDWHNLTKQVRAQVAEHLDDPAESHRLTMQFLSVFYVQPYTGGDFYKEFYERLGESAITPTMNYKALLWDIDGTLLDFLEAEKCAVRACFAQFHLGVCTDEMLARYSAINRRYWEALERGELTKQEVLVGRYREFFAGEGLDTQCAEAFNEEYQIRLGDTCIFRDNGYELVKELRGRVKQYAVTNGTARAQERKLQKSGLKELLDGVFISDKIGYEKPSNAFFDAVFAELDRTFGPGGYRRDEILIIGDSLTSDIRGGNNAGIRTCWYNPTHSPNNRGVTVDYEIADLREVVSLIKKSPYTEVHNE